MNRESAYKLNTHITGVLQAKRWKEAVDKIYDDFESESLRDNDLLSITYEAGRQAGKDSMKSEIAKAYMEGSESGRESMAKQDDR